LDSQCPTGWCKVWGMKLQNAERSRGELNGSMVKSLNRWSPPKGDGLVVEHQGRSSLVKLRQALEFKKSGGPPRASGEKLPSSKRPSSNIQRRAKHQTACGVFEHFRKCCSGRAARRDQRTETGPNQGKSSHFFIFDMRLTIYEGREGLLSASLFGCKRKRCRRYRSATAVQIRGGLAGRPGLQVRSGCAQAAVRRAKYEGERSKGRRKLVQGPGNQGSSGLSSFVKP